MTDVERWPEEEIFLKELGMHGSGDVIAYSPEVIGPLGPDLNLAGGTVKMHPRSQ